MFCLTGSVILGRFKMVFASLETRKIRPAIFSGIVTGKASQLQ